MCVKIKENECRNVELAQAFFFSLTWRVFGRYFYKYRPQFTTSYRRCFFDNVTTRENGTGMKQFHSGTKKSFKKNWSNRNRWSTSVEFCSSSRTFVFKLPKTHGLCRCHELENLQIFEVMGTTDERRWAFSRDPFHEKRAGCRAGLLQNGNPGKIPSIENRQA